MSTLKYISKLENRNKAELILDELVDYYQEGPRKQARRKEFYNQLIEELIINNNYQLNFSELCKLLNVERKSLYRYFQTKDDMLVDIAYLAVIYVNEKYLIVANEIYNLEQYDSETKLKLTLRDIANTIIYYRELAPFFQYFDDRLSELPEDSSAKNRYRELMTAYKIRHHYLIPILDDLRAEGKLIDKYDNCQIAEIFEQTYAVFVSRTVTKLNESDRYSYNNINILIDIFLNGILNSYEM